MSRALDPIRLLQDELRRLRHSKLASYYPDAGPLRRELYPKHLQFFQAGADHRERALIAANRIGKTEGVGGFETTLHLTGLYPSWWAGRRFNQPITGWACGDTNRTTRDIVQRVLMGPTGDYGTGMIPKDLIVRHTTKVGIADAIEQVFVRHVSGGISELGFKSYDSGRDQFQGTNRHLIWLDEEPARDIYVECLLRTMNVGGMVMATFTPLLGMSDLCRDFLQQAEDGTKCVVTATWDDVPHLTAEAKAELLASIPEFQRDARTKGVPVLGAGAVYPVTEKDFVIDPFAIPDYWPRCFGLDVGWNKTAAVWLARNNETQTLYAYAEHYAGKQAPVMHAAAIKAVGAWIPGVIDPASCGSSQVDGTRLIDAYRELGLSIGQADNAVEAGIFKVWNLLTTGRLKVFRSLQNLLGEFRLYQRDSDGKIKKQNDHALDALRYAVMSGTSNMRTKQVVAEKPIRNYSPGESSYQWMM